MIAIPAGNLTEMVGQYLTEKTGATFAPGMFQALAIVNDQRDFVGGVVVSNFRNRSCEISCAADTSAAWRPSVMRAVFTYIFVQLDCVRCTAITMKRNKRARDFLEGLGFVLEGNLRLGYDGKNDALVYGLLASECRYLAVDSGNDTDGQRHSSSASSAGPVRDGGSADAREHLVGDGAGEPESDQSGDAARLPDVHAERDERGRDAEVHSDADVLTG